MKFNNIYRYVLFVLFLVCTSMAIWSVKMKAFEFDKLDGSFEQKMLVDLNVSNWFSGDFQKSLEEYIVLGNHMSPFFIRVSNQIDYSLFNQVHIGDGVLGKEGNLYQLSYITSYYGKDFVGEAKLTEYVKKMKFVQDTLEKLNKEFIYIQAPGKASFYPEYIPDSLRGPIVPTNYDVLIKLLDEYGIKHINFKPYFMANKNTSAHPLFTRTGIHWSKYAMALAMDSITKFIEKDMHIDMPDMYWDEIDMHLAQYEDKDLEAAGNLVFPMYYEKYAYPEMKVESFKGKTVPKLLMIGDSYMGNLYWDHYFESYDSTSQYWFYNNSVFSLSFPDRIHKYQLDQLEVVKNSEIIILGCTEPNVKGTSWNFIDKLYDYYKYGKRKNYVELDFLSGLDSVRTHIKEKGLYQGQIQALSATQKISLDSAITVRALWLINEQKVGITK